MNKEQEQEKLKPDKDVLIVTDNKTGERGVVTGLDEKGHPKKVPIKPEHQQDFLKFDKNGNALDNFFTNFVRQCKEPTRFGFYKTTTAILDRIFARHEDASEDIGGEQINPSNYSNKNKKSMEQNPNNNAAETQGQQQENKHQYQPIDETKVNWADIQQKWGITRDQLDQSGDLTKMLNYGKSNLLTVHPTFLGGEQLETAARLSFKKGATKLTSVSGRVPRGRQRESRSPPHPQGGQSGTGVQGTHIFRCRQVCLSKNYGNMGRVVDLLNERGERVPMI